MAHFAKLNSDNIVVEVVVISNDVLLDDDGVEQEQLGIDFLEETFKTVGDYTWVQTSFNMFEGVHYTQVDDPNKEGNTISQVSEDQSKALRKNFAGIGHKYDPDRDAFIPWPKRYASWVLNEDKCTWEAPVERPPLTDDGVRYLWNEDNLSWELEEEG